MNSPLSFIFDALGGWHNLQLCTFATGWRCNYISSSTTSIKYKLVLLETNIEIEFYVRNHPNNCTPVIDKISGHSVCHTLFYLESNHYAVNFRYAFEKTTNTSLDIF